MDFTYVENNSFSINNVKKIFFFLKKIKKIFIEFHIMSKLSKNIINKIQKKNIFVHLENFFFFKRYNYSISPNFCYKYIKQYNFNYNLIMSVNPGFGNQFFIKNIKKKKINKYNIDGGINFYYFKKINNYFNKIIIGSNIISKKNINSYFNFLFIYNEFIVL
ncbi:ribulose-phosphate 3-epimerase [Candidatus Carsonella ruddii CS isolate Thao2000]|uniref:Ribulose-phosphate 3-epimerase n=2 Tax=Carsonella ruddii TaxID=114186 RepID=J7H0C4_CARRU|nr:ribulose-phosphate 3-epimerase [Candidatus Carsonella ruddii CS isolate Thao2000]